MLDCIKPITAKLCLAVLAVGVVVAIGLPACAQIATLDKQLAESNASVARASAIPGAVVPEPPEPPPSGPSEDMVIAGMFFTFAALLPLVIAYARRIWRRSAKVIQAIPPELYERLTRIEQGMDAVAVEVERIGEGQRFMTRLFNEAGEPRALGVGAAQPVEVGRGERVAMSGTASDER